MTKGCCVAAMLVSAVLAFWAPAEAAPENLNQLLRGDYAFSGEATCRVISTTQSPPPPFPPPDIRSFSIKGIRTYNGDGTGTGRAQAALIYHSGANEFSDVEVEFDFNYNVAPDRTFTLNATNVNAEVIAGAGAGGTFTVTGIQFIGHISEDRKTLVLATGGSNLETWAFFNSLGNPVFSQTRRCHRARVDVKIQPQ